MVTWEYNDIDDGWAATVNGVYCVIYYARGEWSAEIYLADRVRVVGVWRTLDEAEAEVEQLVRRDYGAANN